MSFDTRLLNGLNVLAAIVEAGNFVRAGEALGLTQSGVSRAMQRLRSRAATCMRRGITIVASHLSQHRPELMGSALFPHALNTTPQIEQVPV